ncbi:MAG TPA: polysaccharide biosynthesis/export family protein [Candidatus Acidoferrum sp.]|nr:polysaccharide biosynthesis/export family protein [Candidatus Acidoferrum sp.]
MQRIPNFLSHPLSLAVVLGLVGLLQVALAQNSGAVPDAARPQDTTTEPLAPSIRPLVAAPEKARRIETSSSALVLGPGDELEITVYGAPDLSGHSRVSADGNISMPLIGYVRIAGLSSSEAEGAIEAKLRQDKVVNDPQVSVYVKEYGSSGISVTGEVAKPGFYSALGPHRLFDVLQAAGGPTDKAANKVLISHRGQDDATTLNISKDSTEIAASNVELRPGDTVVVPKAGIVYVLGEVTRPGGYVLNSTGGITVLQVIAAAGGPTHVASAGKTRLLRRAENGFQEQGIDVKKLLRGKAHDVSVRDQDILFIPSSAIKQALNSGALLASASTAAIYRVPF